MHQFYTIAMDVHSYSIHVFISTPTGRRRCEQSLPMCVPSVRELILKTPRPRHLVFEEGPLAGWLYRSLEADVDKVVVAETRRNAYIARDGDKTDAIDAAKLAQLYQGEFIRPVYHPVDPRHAYFKDLVQNYNRQVKTRVSAANCAIWGLRQHGIVACQKDFIKAEERRKLFDRLPNHRSVRLNQKILFDNFDQLLKSEQQLADELKRRANKIRMVRQFMELPGVGVVRASEFYAIIDTPFRFPKKSALWRYMGIGLERKASGRGYERVGLSNDYNRTLKDMILGAARDAVGRCKDNPFAQQYRSWIDDGCTPPVARRNTARSMAAVMWGMFKSKSRYRPDIVGIPSGQVR